MSNEQLGIFHPELLSHLRGLPPEARISAELEILQSTAQQMTKKINDLIEDKENEKFYYQQKAAKGYSSGEFVLISNKTEIAISRCRADLAEKSFECTKKQHRYHIFQVDFEHDPLQISFVNCEYMSFKSYFRVKVQVSNPQDSSLSGERTYKVDTGAEVSTIDSATVRSLSLIHFNEVTVGGILNTEFKRLSYHVIFELDGKKKILDVVEANSYLLGMDFLKEFSLHIINASTMTITALP